MTASHDRTHRGAGLDDEGATSLDTRPAHDDHSTQEAFIGTERSRAGSNVSWGAIFAGVVTFLALTLLLNIATAAMGLQGTSGAAAGIWSVIALAIALAAAGYVAGALAARAGLLHGFLAWATSMLAVLVLAGWLGSSLLGAVGNIAGTAAQTAAETTTTTGQDVEDAAGEVEDTVSQGDLDEVQQEVEAATDDIAGGAWWAFAGALIGALIAAFAGAAGARSVINRDEEVAVERRRPTRR
ncbi:hypothetical protein [Ornithinimicrobium sediminis]|uniref:hypothetical protein n=1 Tax=Ornithinimicrobium sediminis TaxID=2904603 RepID=UPI001E45F603|nr:hypothetical protein [Ornithinimicrobium sediminis]MCE0488213.1 hypothetical protein [Ornithinimicrobium sediminis]